MTSKKYLTLSVAAVMAMSLPVAAHAVGLQGSGGGALGLGGNAGIVSSPPALHPMSPPPVSNVVTSQAQTAGSASGTLQNGDVNADLGVGATADTSSGIGTTADTTGNAGVSSNVNASDSASVALPHISRSTLNRLQKNTDGSVTLQQFMKGNIRGGETTFNRLDTNGDGVLSQAELDAAASAGASGRR